LPYSNKKSLYDAVCCEAYPCRIVSVVAQINGHETFENVPYASSAFRSWLLLKLPILYIQYFLTRNRED